MKAASYVHGASDTPLLGETIGDNLRAHRRALRRPRRARRPLAGLPRHLPRALGRDDRASRAGCSRSASRRATASASGRPTASSGSSLQYATARVGAILVNINPAYKTAELEYALRQSGTSVLLPRARASARATTSRMLAEVRGRCPDLRLALVLDDDWDALLDGGARVTDARRSTTARRTLAVRRPDQHPVHLRHHRLPQGGDALAPQRPQQRLLRRRGACACTERDRVCIPVPVLPLLRHGPGQPRVHARTARRWSSPARRSTRSPCLEAVAGRALHGALRRADDVHRRARSPALRRVRPVARLRTGIMAGSPCPVEVMKQRAVARCTCSEVTICYGMTETSPVSTQTAPPTIRWSKRVGTVGRVHPHVEVKIVDPRDGRRRAARRARASCARAATA